MTAALILLGLTYLFGSVPFGLVITTLYGGDLDIRQAGSANIGATNVARLYGWRLAAPALAADILKGLLPVLVASWLWPHSALGWLGVVGGTAWLGHCFSIFLEFRGGKGVATGAGVMLGIAPLPTAASIAVWAIVLALSGRSSVAALTAVAAMVGFTWQLSPPALLVATLLAAGTLLTHLANIERLFRGEEQPVVKSVRWNRAAPEQGSVEQLLAEGPAGAGSSPPQWRETIDDPLSPH